MGKSKKTTVITPAGAPRMTLSRRNWDKIQHWIKHAKHREISGMGMVERDPDNPNLLHIRDVFLFEQEGNGSTTEFKAQQVGAAMYAMRESPGDLRWWWHTHPGSMSCFWSGTDDEAIADNAEAGWFCATVFDGRANALTRIDMNVPLQHSWDAVLLSLVHEPVAKALTDAWDVEINAKVKPITAPPTPSYSTGYTYGSSAEYGRDFDYTWSRGGRGTGVTTTSGGDAAARVPPASRPNKRTMAEAMAGAPMITYTRHSALLALRDRTTLRDELSEVEEDLLIMHQMGLLTEEEYNGRPTISSTDKTDGPSATGDTGDTSDNPGSGSDRELVNPSAD